MKLVKKYPRVKAADIETGECFRAPRGENTYMKIDSYLFKDNWKMYACDIETGKVYHFETDKELRRIRIEASEPFPEGE